MKRFFVALLICSSLFAIAQKGNKMRNKLNLLKNDSTVQKLIEFKDSIAKTLPDTNTIQVKPDIDRNMNYILELQKERKAKQKRNAIIRIAIGIGFLILLVIGLRRRSKK